MNAPHPFLQWNDSLLLGYTPMDATHEEFVRCVANLQQAEDHALPQRMDELIAHARHHFGEEDRWMEETGFPARECHINEHAQVMKSLLEVRQLLDQNHAALCRDLADELARWFPGHADYLDAALAHWMCKQRHGGKPVVLRRSLRPG